SAQQAEQARHAHDQQQYPIQRRHGLSLLQPWLHRPRRRGRHGCGFTMASPMPSLATTCALSRSASARVSTGPTRTRLSTPLSVRTDSTKACMPAARARSRSLLASTALENAPSCTAKPVLAAAGSLGRVAAAMGVAGLLAAVAVVGAGLVVAGGGAGFDAGAGITDLAAAGLVAAGLSAVGLVSARGSGLDTGAAGAATGCETGGAVLAVAASFRTTTLALT